MENYYSVSTFDDKIISDLKINRNLYKEKIRNYLRINLDDKNAEKIEIRGIYLMKWIIEETLKNLWVIVI